MSKNSIAQLILFIALVIAALGLAGTFVETAGYLSNAVSEHGDRVETAADADVEIISDPRSGAVWNGSADRVTVLVKNVGEGRLPATPGAVDVLIDDALVTNESITVVGSGDDWTPGEVVRIRFNRSLPDGHHRLSVSVDGAKDHLQFGTGEDPLAAFSIDPSPARTYAETIIDANDSYDPDGSIDSYRWDFGADGTNDSSGETVTRSWNDPRTVTVTLTVTDDSGNTDSTTRTFRVYPANWRTFAYWTNDTGHHPATNPPKSNVGKDWGYDLGPNATDDVTVSSAAVVNETVYVGSDDGYLYAFDATDGSLRWRAETNGSIRSSPAVVDGTVYVGSRDHGLHAFDVDDGSERWNVSTGNTIDSSPTVVDGTVYVGSDDDTLYAIWANNGTERWSYTTGGNVGGTPAVENGVVYVGSRDGFLYAIDATGGDLLWRTDVGDVVASAPAVVGDRIYLGVYGTNSTVAVNATSHEIVWNATLGDRVYSSPAVANGTVYVGDGSGAVHALDAESGNVTWTETTGAEIRSSPAVANGTVVVTSTDGAIYAYDATTGTQYWRYDAGSPITASPAILNATVYVGIDDPAGDDVIAITGDVAAPSVGPMMTVIPAPTATTASLEADSPTNRTGDRSGAGETGISKSAPPVTTRGETDIESIGEIS